MINEEKSAQTPLLDKNLYILDDSGDSAEEASKKQKEPSLEERLASEEKEVMTQQAAINRALHVISDKRKPCLFACGAVFFFTMGLLPFEVWAFIRANQLRNDPKLSELDLQDLALRVNYTKTIVFAQTNATCNSVLALENANPCRLSLDPAYSLLSQACIAILSQLCSIAMDKKDQLSQANSLDILAAISVFSSIVFLVLICNSYRVHLRTISPNPINYLYHPNPAQQAVDELKISVAGKSVDGLNAVFEETDKRVRERKKEIEKAKTEVPLIKSQLASTLSIFGLFDKNIIPLIIEYTAGSSNEIKPTGINLS